MNATELERIMVKYLSDPKTLHNDNTIDNNSYIYVVRLNRINNDKPIVFYSVIKYPDIFSYHLLSFVLGRNDPSNSVITKNEWGDYLTLVDPSVIPSEISDDFYNRTIEMNAEIGKAYENSIKFNKDFRKKESHITKIIDMHNIISKCLIESDRNSFLMMESSYRLKDIIFIVKDIKSFISVVESTNGFTINKGDKAKRHELNSSLHFLTCFDLDFRFFIKNRVLSQLGENYGNESDISKNSSVLKQNSFTFRNIHMRSGSIRHYSTRVDSHNNYISNTLSELENLNKDKDLSELQKSIEEVTLQQYRNNSEKNIRIIENINLKYLNKYVLNFWNDKEKNLSKYLDLAIKRENTDTMNNFVNEILRTIGIIRIKDICLRLFLEICTYNDSDNEDYKKMLKVPNILIRIGNVLFNTYINISKDEYNKKHGTMLSHSQFKLLWEKENIIRQELVKSDNLQVNIGATIIDILNSAGLVSKKLEYLSYNNKEYSIQLADSSILSKTVTRKVYKVPNKLPMLVKPKKYDKNTYGGYLMNDILFSEQLIIHKSNQSRMSNVNESNGVYCMINNMQETPFKINKKLLEFLSEDKFNLLTVFKEKEKDDYSLTVYKRKKYESERAKYVLQETILDIAEFFKNFDSLYFPLRMDSRGRIYCLPEYFNYQSNELAKSLILFVEPANIARNNTDSIAFLQAYGASVFGGNVKRQSIKSKIDWVEANEHDIINYDNGKLIKLAKEPFLFTAFCMEYKRYIEFVDNESLSHFKTYLPILLDATCNGFQHLALLSNQSTLFKELNITSSKDNSLAPKDFYSFIIHKVQGVIKSSLNFPGELSKEDIESYERLNKVILDRSVLKKAIMTIPYNASHRSMTQYIKADLTQDTLEGKNIFRMGVKDKYLFSKDIDVLVKIIRSIIDNDFTKIKNLTKYLKNVATLYCKIGLPLEWSVPSGLEVRQGYLESSSTTLTPFMYSKTRLVIKKYDPQTLDKKKMVRALMPNLIHSLDATSLNLLYNKLHGYYPDSLQFYSVHDCFGTTCDKINILKIMLSSVYTELYSDIGYLRKFDANIINHINNVTTLEVDKEKRCVLLDDGPFMLHDLDWVCENKQMSKKILLQIDAQNILV